MGKQMRICLTSRAVLESLQGHSFSPTTKLVALVRFMLGASFSVERAAELVELDCGRVGDALNLLALVGTFDQAGKFTPKPGRGAVDVARQERGRGPELLAEFARLWSARYGSKCVTGAKDRTEADKLVRLLGLEEAKQRLGRYFADPDPWLAQNAHPFVVFCRQVNRFVSGRKDEQGTKAPGIAGRDETDRDVEQLERGRSSPR